MIAEAHRNQKCFIVRADDKLTAFLELEAATRGIRIQLALSNLVWIPPK
jgi:hypothetical protein